MDTKDEVKLIKYQERATITYEIILVVSFLLLYDEEKRKEKKDGLFSQKTRSTLSMINRTVIVIICVVFLYANSQNLKWAKSKNKDTSSLELQLFGSALVLISAVIAAYVVFKDVNKENVGDFENPEI